MAEVTTIVGSLPVQEIVVYVGAMIMFAVGYVGRW